MPLKILSISEAPTMDCRDVALGILHSICIANISRIPRQISDLKISMNVRSSDPSSPYSCAGKSLLVSSGTAVLTLEKVRARCTM